MISVTESVIKFLFFNSLMMSLNVLIFLKRRSFFRCNNNFSFLNSLHAVTNRFHVISSVKSSLLKVPNSLKEHRFFAGAVDSPQKSFVLENNIWVML